MTHLSEFMGFAHDVGLAMETQPIDDGALHRFTVIDDKPASNNGWYILFGDGLPSGIVGSWKTGESYKWSSKDNHALSDAERRQFKQRQQQAMVLREREKAIAHTKAAKECQHIWATAKPATDHSYLTTKGIQAHGARLHKGALIIPVRNIQGQITSLQFIQHNGLKRFYPNGLIRGGYCAIGVLGKRLFICEGYATGATIHEQTGDAIAVAFNAGNLKPVAQALRQKHPDLPIVIAADNDHEKPSNVGIAKAQEAAQAVNALMVWPPTLKGVSDFNDLAKINGSIEVAA